MKLDFRIKVRIFFIVSNLAIIGVFLWFAIVPSGEIEYWCDFNNESNFISKLSPSERIQNGGKLYPNQIVGNPVYFNLRTSRSFEKADMEIKYKRNKEDSRYPIVEAGVLVDKNSWRYELQPVENSILRSIDLAWNKHEFGDIVLYSNPMTTNSSSTFENIGDFKKKLISREKIAVYNYDIKKDFLLLDYNKNELINVIEHPLRGEYQFYTYIKDEDLNFRFYFKDLNRNKDSDEISIFLYYEDTIIDSKRIEDDGVTVDSGEESEQIELEFNQFGLPEGVYKIEIKVNDDVVTNKIETTQSKLSFVNKLWLHESESKDVKIFSEGRQVNAQTKNPASLQKITVGDSYLDIAETFKLHSIVTSSSSNTIVVPKPDVILSNNGVFSFWEEGLINPKLKKVDELLDFSDIDYVLASYVAPEKDGDWNIANLNIDLKKAYRENGVYGFMISIPGLELDKNKDFYLEIDYLKINLNGVSLLDKIKSIL